MWIIDLFICILYVFNPFFLTNISYIYTYFTFKNGNPKDMLYLVPFNIYICLMGCIFGSFYIDNITDMFQWITGINPYQVLYFEDQEYPLNDENKSSLEDLSFISRSSLYNANPDNCLDRHLKDTKSIFQSLAIAYHIFPTMFLYVYGSMLLTHTDYRKWYQTMSFQEKIDFYTNYSFNSVNKVKRLLVIYCLCGGYLIYNLSTMMIWVIIISILPIINAISIFVNYEYGLGFLPYQTNVV